MPPLPREVFFSHASADRLVANRLTELLTGHGIPVWYSRRNILGARQWHDEIKAAFDRCDWFLVLLTPSAVASMWVKRELLYALQQERFENQIIPVIAESCPYDRLSWTLSLFQTIDLTRSFEAGARELLRVWGVGYRSDVRTDSA